MDTIPNNDGCDSVMTIDLTIVPNTTSYFNLSTCNAFTSPSGNYTWTSSGTYMDTIPNNGGCDSVITFYLTIYPTTTGSVTLSTCHPYTSPSGTYTWTSSGTYMDTIPNNGGCDSIITFYLTVNTATSATITANACATYTSPSGNYTWATSGTYSDTIPNTAGCDSLITINLTIDSANTGITQNGATLTSDAIGASYQWLDCDDNYAPMPGATEASFTATQNGNYAVAVVLQDCADTSACMAVTSIGLEEQ